VIIGQLGDGLITVTKNGQLSFFESNQDHFINETTSINRSKFKNWRINVVELQPNDVVVLSMMTDGISNDLNRQNYSKFLDFILNNLSKFHVSKDKNNYLNDLLVQLPNQNNKDDKSFVIGLST
jgi:serine/threonine protein phosphatase PrpC